jgi:hypothetical protein
MRPLTGGGVLGNENDAADLSWGNGSYAADSTMQTLYNAAVSLTSLANW